MGFPAFGHVAHLSLVYTQIYYSWCTFIQSPHCCTWNGIKLPPIFNIKVNFVWKYGLNSFIHSFIYLSHTFLQKQRAVAIRATFFEVVYIFFERANFPNCCMYTFSASRTDRRNVVWRPGKLLWSALNITRLMIDVLGCRITCAR